MSALVHRLEFSLAVVLMSATVALLSSWARLRSAVSFRARLRSA